MLIIWLPEKNARNSPGLMPTFQNVFYVNCWSNQLAVARFEHFQNYH